MKHSMRWMTLTMAMVAGVSWAADTKDLKTAKAVPGQKLYEKQCASCHGKDGKGNEKMAKMFKVDPKLLDLLSEEVGQDTDEMLIKAIADGKNKMPAFSKKMKPEEMKEMVGYLRSLAPKEEEKKTEEKKTDKK